MKNSLVLLSILALGVACAPAGSKSVTFKSGPESSSGGEPGVTAQSLKDGSELPIRVYTIRGEDASVIFMRLGGNTLEGKNEKGQPVNIKGDGTDIRCEETIPQEKSEESHYSCTFQIYKDGTFSKKKPAQPTPVVTTTSTPGSQATPTTTQ